MELPTNPKCPICGGFTPILDSKGAPCACSRGCKTRQKHERNIEAKAKTEAKATSKTEKAANKARTTKQTKE